MKLTPIIAVAILAYTAGAVPVKQPSNQITKSTASNQTERIKTTTQLGPIPVAVTPNGFMKPEIPFSPSPSTGGVLKDYENYPHFNTVSLGGHCSETHPNRLSSSDHQDNNTSLPSKTELESHEKTASNQLYSRAAMWKPVEINSYHEGVKIDIKNSIFELRDKLDYLNTGGQLDADQANRDIDNLSKVIATRIRINFVTNAPNFDEMLSALQKHIISEIKTRRHNLNISSPLNETQQAEQDALHANLHAQYILKGLQEKIVLLARTGKLTERLGNLSIGQARQMIKTTPNMLEKDSEFCEIQLKMIEKAIRTMMKKKLVDFPASAVAAIVNPIKSDFKLPGEDDTSVEAPTDSQPNVQTENVEQTPGNADTPTENSTNSTDYSAAPSNLGEVTLHKRDSDSQDEPTRDTNLTNDIELPTVVDEQGEDRFWIDYGAPECMKYILDDDLDLEKLNLFDTCQANATSDESDATEAPDVADTTDPTEDPEGELEQRDIEKHMYEIEEDGDEWGRKTLIKGDGDNYQ
ncbi:hypothetical protein BKA64DRAFT_749547 [Cadophora sp. MPI-SDFR-AT-0126]|nr:hypothetical protein BKA64DRAFT_749547 [Leotiomycetes sp. MPI-SDFR-AT-0126]